MFVAELLADGEEAGAGCRGGHPRPDVLDAFWLRDASSRLLQGFRYWARLLFTIGVGTSTGYSQW